MRRSTNRRAASRRRLDRRIIAAAGAIVVFGAIAGVTALARADETPGAPAKGAKTVNGLTILANSCQDSKLPPHDGFQKGDRCVSTAFGEVGSAANNPSLLITDSPQSVGVNQPFTLKVSTRNLIRDRFLAAGAGGYYVESSVLEGGIVRGHFHTACRMLDGTSSAPAPDPVPAFFVATEDSKGGKTPDTVTINVPGLPEAGTAQCAAWAGDGSHRIPMMERANQTPAIDAVRVTVRDSGGGGQNTGGGAGNGGGATKPPATQPPATGGNNNGGQQSNNGGQQSNNGGQQSNNGGQQGGSNSGGNAKPPTTAPTKAATSGIDTRSVMVKPKSSAATKAPARTENTTTTTSGDDQSTYHQPAPAKTKKSTAAVATSDDQKTTVSDDGATLDKNAQPDAQAAPTTRTIDAAPKAATTKSSLALTGTNTVMVIGVGAILLIIGLIVLTTTRRRPGGYR